MRNGKQLTFKNSRFTVIHPGKYICGGNVHGAEDHLDFYDEVGINELNEKGLVFMRWQAYKMSAFYISLSEDVPAGFGDEKH